MTQTKQVEVTQADVALERLLWRLSVTWASADEMQRAIARHRQSSIAPLVEEVEHQLATGALANLDATTDWIDGYESAWKIARAALSPLPAKEGE